MSRITDFAAFARNPRQQPTNMAFLNGFTYGLSLNAMMLLIPLYAIDHGVDLKNLGVVVAAPAIFMIILRLPGGAICDRFGEKVVLFFAFATLLIAAVVAILGNSFLALFTSQLFSGMSRSVYWSAAQSYISRSAEGQVGKNMGRQLFFESGAGIVGAAAGGVLSQYLGFPWTFGIVVALSAAGLTVTSSLPSLPRKEQVRSILASFAPVKTMLFSRSLAFAHLVSFMAACYAGLISSLFIPFFKDVGYSNSMTGGVRSLNSIGVVLVAYFFGVVLARFGARTVGVLGMALTGVVSMAVAVTGTIPVLPVALMTLSGVTFGTLRTLYPVLAAQKSAPNQRAMALAVVSLYWAVAMLLSPLVFGFIADGTSIGTALIIFGGFSVVVGVLSPLMYAVGNRHEAAQASPATQS